MNILITSISAKVQLIQAFKDAVRPLGGLIVGTDMDEKCCASHFVDAFVTLPPYGSDSYAASLLEVCRRYSIDLIIPTRDGELIQLAGLRRELTALNIALPLPSKEQLQTCLDKRRFHEFCTTNGYPVLPTVNPEDKNSFPLFVRAINTSNGKVAYEVPDLQVWEMLGLDRTHFICQPICTDNEYSVDLLMDMDGKPLQAVARHRQRLVNGESWRSEIVALPDLEAMVMEIGGKLGLRAHNLVQAFVSPSGDIHLIEVNPRFGGCSNLSVAGGLDSPRRIIQMVQGNMKDARINPSIRHGLQSNRYSLDIFSMPGSGS